MARIPSILRTRFVQVGAVNGASKLAMVVAEFALAARLGLGTLGVVSVAMAMVLTLGSLASLGLPWTLAREWSDADNDEVRAELAGGSVALSGQAGVVAGAALLVFTLVVLGESDFRLPLCVAAILVPLEAVNQTQAGLLRAMGRADLQFYAWDLWRNLSFVVIAIVSPTGMAPSTIVLLLVPGTGLAAVIGVWLTRAFSGAPLRRSLLRCRTLVKQSYSVTLWNVLQLVAGRTQVLIAAAFLTRQETGIVSLLFRSMMALTFLQSTINAIVPPVLAKLLGDEKRDDLARLYSQLCGVLIPGVTAIIGAVLILAPIVEPELGATNTAVAVSLVVLLGAQGLNVATGPMGQLLVVDRNYSGVLRISLLTVVVQFALSLSLLPMIGVLGAAVADAAKTVVGTSLRLGLGIRGSVPLMALALNAKRFLAAALLFVAQSFAFLAISDRGSLVVLSVSFVGSVTLAAGSLRTIPMRQVGL